MAIRVAAANRPDISTRKVTRRVARSTAQRSWNRKLAPACALVAMAPMSKKPPTAVRMPSASCSHFLIASPDGSATSARPGSTAGAAGRGRSSRAGPTGPPAASSGLASRRAGGRRCRGAPSAPPPRGDTRGPGTPPPAVQRSRRGSVPPGRLQGPAPACRAAARDGLSVSSSALAGDLGDDVVAQPPLPVEGRRFGRLHLELDVVGSDVFHLLPGDPVARGLADSDAAAEPLDPTLHARVDAPGQHHEPHLDRVDPRGLVRAHLEDETVDPPHLRLVLIDHLLVAAVTGQVQLVHQLPPTIASGMETTARTKARMTRQTVTAFESGPFACSRSSLRSFISSRKGMATKGRTAALMAMVRRVSFSGSMPNRMSSEESRIAPV